MKRILLFTVLIVSIEAWSQKALIKFGDIPMEDMTMKVYPKDSSAEAVVLVDYGDSRISYLDNKGFNLSFDRITRIKILRKEGYHWANFEIPLYESNSKKEDYSSLKASTFNLENGKITETKMRSDAIFKEQTNENWRLIKFTLPNIKEGSIVEVSYTVSSPFWFNFQDWEFQSTIPTRLSEYRAKIPEYFSYQKNMQGYIIPAVNEVNNVSKSILLTTKDRSEGLVTQTTFSNDKIDYIEVNSRWAANFVPAFKPEPFMNSIKNYISRINFELAYVKMPNQAPKSYMGSWEGINNEFLKSENFGEVVNRSNFLNKKVEELTTGMSEENQKISSIYNYVKENIEWDKRNRKYANSNLKEVLDSKKGSSADINLILTSMLKKADFVAEPVLVSTRDNGLVREFIPESSQFNYVICAVKTGNKTLLLDATDHLLPMNILPERCLNGSGFLVSKENSGWVNLNSNFKSKTSASFDLVINEEGQLSGKITMNNSGYEAQQVRMKYFSKGEPDYLKQMSEDNRWQIQKNQIENINSLSEPVKETYEVAIEDYAQSSGGVIYINPILKYRIELNPFKVEKREYPVDFKSPFERLIVGKIAVPEGYQVDELPKPKIIGLPNNDGRYTYNVSLVGNIISVTSILSINKALFNQEEYIGLREFYNQVVAKQAEQIVLKKK